MFLSLKGALGRNPMINRVGQRLLQAFEGASAAYSLRDLASNIASVVRVRRASDNTEKDFSAVDVSSGAMTEWVNAQVVLPLDVRELVDGERTGALIPAAAAYSLRNLSASYTGNVVGVRRSSDDDEEEFTAAEVADGTLTDWVNTDVNVTDLQPESGSLIGNVTAETATGYTFDLNNEGSDGYKSFCIDGSSSRTQTLTFNAVLNSGSFTGVSVYSPDIPDQPIVEGFNTVTLTNSTGTAPFLFVTGTAVCNATLSNIVATQTSADGFVSQWYDQSGNGNHATQGTPEYQPKIVDAGSLITLNGAPAFKFTSSSTRRFDLTSPIADISDFSVFFVAEVADVSGRADILSSNNSNFLRMRDEDFQFVADGTDSGVVDFNSTLTDGGQYSLGFIRTANTLTASANGTVQANTVSNSSTLAVSKILGGGTLYSTWTTKTQELILYTSDQTDNRTAFEANIGEAYGIDLPSGVDTGYDQVDGFVETWYDQSGNGSDAVQETAGSQPKIVDAGVFLGQVDFLNGVNTFLGTNNSDLANLSELSLFSVLEPVTASVNEFAISAGSIVNSTGNYGGWALWANGYADRLDFATQARGSGTNTRAQVSITSTSPIVYSATLNGTNAQGAVNGVLGAENTSMINPNNTDATRRKLRLGCQFTYEPVSFYRGAMKEVIFYASDQSANRAAIEANINNQYNIY